MQVSAAALDLIVALIRIRSLRYDELSSDLFFPYFYLIRCGLSGKLIARVALKGDTGEITYRIYLENNIPSIFRVSRSYRRHCPEQEEC